MTDTLLDAPAVVVHDVTKTFGERDVLSDLDLTVGRGEFVALLGASGSGKTTLLRILLGLEGVSRGDVFVPEVRTTVFQEPRLVVSMKVWRNVVIGQPRQLSTRDARRGRAQGSRLGGPRRCLARHPLGRRGAARGPGPGARPRAPTALAR